MQHYNDNLNDSAEKEMAQYLPKDVKYEKISINGDSDVNGVDPEIGEYQIDLNHPLSFDMGNDMEEDMESSFK